MSEARSSRVSNVSWLIRAFLARGASKLGLSSHWDTEEDQAVDRIAPFDEYPPCDLCGSLRANEKFIARDGSRIVECEDCKLWFTSPRIDEQVWINWLKGADSARNVEFTENRLRYGVALSGNIKKSMPNWRNRRASLDKAIISSVRAYLGRELNRLHDVGCGVGFLLSAAREEAIVGTGNELNAYACKIMNERLGLKVYNDTLPRVNLPPNSLDAVIMHDYIEHTYHPSDDLQTSSKLLRPGGILRIDTFHVDCAELKKYGGNWKFLFWNHVYHFSKETLLEMVKKANLRPVQCECNYDNHALIVIAKKE